ncbi:hypothetical protein ACTXT7_016367 [Hymenolepis weldensis]
MLSRVSMEIAGPRAIHSSQWGLICPSDTPEGESCGLVKNVSLMCHITVEVDDTNLIRILKTYNVFDLKDFRHQPDEYIVFVNGKPIGFTKNPKELCTAIRGLRRTRHINEFVSVHCKPILRCVHVVSDGGRLCRPYIIVHDGEPLVTQEMINDLQAKMLNWEDFLKLGVIEYLDSNELNDCLVALDEDSIVEGTTHMEIDPSTILGALAGLIPYPNHNQSPRNTYQCAMGKQAMGVAGLNQQIRFDTLQLQMVYSQRPLVETKTSRMLHFHELPAGQNAVIAIMSFTGYDVEDALILNKASIDRGFMRASVYRRVGVHLKSHDGVAHDRLMGPIIDTVTKKPRRNDQLLEADGTAAVGSKAESHFILINKEMPVVKSSSINENGGSINVTAATPPSAASVEFKRTPQDHKSIEPFIVDKVLFASSDGGQTTVKVLLRQTRIPEIGDKFSSRHGQKGVAGLIVPQSNLPFNKHGISPDIIMNPHGFPSRMTVAKLLELLSGKATALDGNIRDGSAFGPHPVEELKEVLPKYGYSCLGKEVLISGATGQPMEAYIYTGVVYYQRLKHMVLDKVHARSRGPVTALTRQPTEGRSREGGLRVGEMERDCLIAYGASQLLLERLMLSSDAYEAVVCEACGLFASSPTWCQYCKSSAKQRISKIRLPYACKLLFQELMCMRIFPRMTLSAPNESVLAARHSVNKFSKYCFKVIADTKDKNNSTKEINKPERIETKLQIASVSSAEQELSEGLDIVPYYIIFSLEGFILEDERIESAEERELDDTEEDYEEGTLVQDEQDNLSNITAIEVELDLTNNLSGLIDPQGGLKIIITLTPLNLVGEPCFAEKLPKIRKARRLRRRHRRKLPYFSPQMIPDPWYRYTSSNFSLTYLIPQDKNGLPMRISFPLTLTSKHNLNLDAEGSTHAPTSLLPQFLTKWYVVVKALS